MIPAAFEYAKPKSLAEVFELQRRHGFDAQLLAGGHTLLPMMKLRLAAPQILIDLSSVESLRQVKVEPDFVAVGAMVTHASVGSRNELGGARSVIRDACSVLADPMVRNRGTLGGSLACADAASDWPAVMLSLNAELELVSEVGVRTVQLKSFYDGFMSTTLKTGEVLQAVRVPSAAAQEVSAYVKLKHPGSGLAVVGAAAVLNLDGPRIVSARVAVTGVNEHPIRLYDVENALAGNVFSESVARSASERARSLPAPMSDRFASAEYRCHLAAVYVRRALEKAWERRPTR